MSNSSTPQPPVRGSGLSLYANLLESSSSTPGSITKGPVVFKAPSVDALDESSAKKPQLDAATLRFQPTKRPQISQKQKPKASFPKPTVSDISRASVPAVVSNTPKPAAKSTLADWTRNDDDVNGFYEGEKRQRGGRKKRKKNKEEYVAIQDWDDIYDPTRPNSYEEYKHSDEKVREVREWKDRLYAHRTARRPSERESDEEDFRPGMSNKFAPPTNYSFAPPPMDSPPRKSAENTHSDSYSPARNEIPPPPPPPPEDMSTAPPVPDAPGAISRAPVRYNLPAAPKEIPNSEAELEEVLAAEEPDEDYQAASTEEGPRSMRPGQKGFAERLMSKYGWSKGTGLGADGSGIVNPLRVQIEKRKKKSDAEGGGFREPGGRGKIIGGNRKAPETKTSKFGVMSEVIVLRGMVDGMDLDEEVEGSGSGGLMQEIGEECGEKYGRVERVYIDRNGDKPRVFVKFTNDFSALRAVNALEGRIFNGNTITALYYDAEAFEQGVYDR